MDHQGAYYTETGVGMSVVIGNVYLRIQKRSLEKEAHM